MESNENTRSMQNSSDQMCPRPDHGMTPQRKRGATNESYMQSLLDLLVLCAIQLNLVFSARPHAQITFGTWARVATTIMGVGATVMMRMNPQ